MVFSRRIDPPVPRLLGASAVFAVAIPIALAPGATLRACSPACADFPPLELSILQADVIFQGTLVETRPVDPPVQDFVLVEAVFEVTSIWKGSVAPVIETVNDAIDSCGFDPRELELDVSYFVYARDSEFGLTAFGLEERPPPYAPCREGRETIALHEGESCTGPDIEPVAFGCAWFRRGDANDDGGRNVSDAVFILNSLFAGGGAILCQDAADANDDGQLNIADAVTLLQFLFSGLPQLPEPFDHCDADWTGDGISCPFFTSCP